MHVASPVWLHVNNSHQECVRDCAQTALLAVGTALANWVMTAFFR